MTIRQEMPVFFRYLRVQAASYQGIQLEVRSSFLIAFRSRGSLEFPSLSFSYFKSPSFPV